MGVAILALAGVSRLSTPRYFVITLKQLEGRTIRIQQLRGQLMDGFEEAWARGMLWSIVLGGAAAGGISYIFSRRIVRPLTQMRSITQELAAGDLSARVPASDIPELDALSRSFNRMASDLETVEQQRRDLVSDLTHELRTPLTIVRGYLEGLADGTVPDSPEMYGRLIRETTRLQRLVDDLQELSKLEASHLPIQLQSVDLAPLLRQVVKRFSGQLGENDALTLNLDLPDTLPPVLADPARVEQVLVNLLSNALRYTAAGQIRVTTRLTPLPAPTHLWVDVADTGMGIATDDLPRVFERFWRADPSRNRNSGGTGIGLAICKRLVELQGGQIEVQSKLDQGSTFRFSLPLMAVD